jgi:hypothetical protein
MTGRCMSLRAKRGNLPPLVVELVKCGTSYADIADMYMMYGRNLVEVETDTDGRRIRFRMKDGGNETKEIHGFLQAHDFQRRIARQNKKTQRTSFSNLMAELSQIGISAQNGRLHIRDIGCLNKAVFENAVANEIRPELLPFDISTDLCGFSFGEYTQFWYAISNWSNCLLLLFVLSLRKGIDQLECVPTQLLTEAEFLSSMVILSGLPIETVGRITERLTYDHANRKAEIFLQPLIRLDGKVLWSPWIIRKSRYDRNMLKLMARTPELKEIADDAVGSRERSFLNLIGRFLACRSGYQYKLNTEK